MNHSQIKDEAKKIMKENMWNIWKPLLIAYIIGLIFNAVLGNFYEPKTKEYETINILFNLLILPINVGVSAYILKVVRNEEYNLSLLTKYYNNFFKIIGISIITLVLCGLGFMLFFIPGIILGLCFVFEFFIFIDNENMSCLDCLKASMNLMKGHKGDFFVFCLSFVGWILLCMLIIPVIYAVPYIMTSIVVYYDKLKKGETVPNVTEVQSQQQ